MDVESGPSGSASASGYKPSDEDFRQLSSGSENEEDADTSNSQSQVVVSLLDRLRAPTLSDPSRKRKVQSNPPVGKKRSKKGGNSVFAPKSITPYDRVKEHPGECLTVSNGKLFCCGCREQLSIKSQVLKLHIRSAREKNA